MVKKKVSTMAPLTTGEKKLVRKEVIVEEVVKPEPTEKQKKWVVLFCDECQAGISGWPGHENFVSGDRCPKCAQKAHHGSKRPENVGILMTCEEKIAKHKRWADMQNELRKKEIKGQPGHEELLNTAKKEWSAEKVKLQNQVDIMAKQLQSILDKKGSEKA